MQKKSGWGISRRALPPPPPRRAPPIPGRPCTNCASAPTANSTFLQQESAPRVSPVATSACGAEGTDSSSHQNSLLFLSVCFTAPLGFPCDQSRAASNGPQSNFFQCKRGVAATFSRDFLSCSRQIGWVTGQWKNRLQRENWIITFAQKGEKHRCLCYVK